MDEQLLQGGEEQSSCEHSQINKDRTINIQSATTTQLFEVQELLVALAEVILLQHLEVNAVDLVLGVGDLVATELQPEQCLYVTEGSTGDSHWVFLLLTGIELVFELECPHVRYAVLLVLLGRTWLMLTTALFAHVKGQLGQFVQYRTRLH